MQIIANEVPINRSEVLGFRKSHAIVIGINEYRGIKSNLSTPINDALEVAKRLKVLQNFDNVLVMKNTSKKQLLTLLNWLKTIKKETSTIPYEKETFPNETLSFPRHHQYTTDAFWLKIARASTTDTGNDGIPKKMIHLEEVPVGELPIDIDTEQDSIVFFYAGHGFPSQNPLVKGGYIGPTDSSLEGTQETVMVKGETFFENSSYLSMDAIYTALNKAKFKHTLLILDCCHAGKFEFAALTSRGFADDLLPLHESRFIRYKSQKAFQVLVSAGANQKANDQIDDAKNSPFTQTLMKALEGAADLVLPHNKGRHRVDGIITAKELRMYIWERVLNETEEVRIQHPDLIEMEGHEDGEFIFLNPNVNPASYEFAADPTKNPYKGLIPYEPEDADLFYGRHKTINLIITKLALEESSNQPKLLFISAPSGAGKSSLVKAGLFPTMERLYGFDELIVFQPAAPTKITGALITPVIEEQAGQEREKIRIRGLYDRTPLESLESIRKQLNPAKKQLVLIDQFEVFFTNLTKEEQTNFEQNLVAIIQETADRQDNSLVFIFTMRSDVEWQLERGMAGKQSKKSTAQTFNNYWQAAHIFRLMNMSSDELRQAIIGPARYAMRDFKNRRNGDFKDMGEKLINKILDEVKPYPASLPWLSCLMRNFYENAISSEDANLLVFADYNKMGGVRGALSMNAEKYYNAQKDNPAKQALIKKIILRMVEPSDMGGGFISRKLVYEKTAKGETTAIPQELMGLGDSNIIKEIIEEMVLQNLLTQREAEEDKAVIEPAHDALINHWPKCRKWINDFGQENIILQRQLWQAVMERAKKTKITEEKTIASN